MRSRSRPLILGLQTLTLILFLGAWEFIVRMKLIDPLFLSGPSQIYLQLVAWIKDGSIWTNTAITLTEAVIGFVIAAAFGAAIGIAIAQFSTLDAVSRPFIDVLNTIPRLALAPLFVLWFGLTAKAKIALVVSVVVFIFIINTYSGFKSVDRDLTTMARSLGASRINLFRFIILPSIAPWLFAAARLGVAMALAGAVVAEIVSSNAGLGYLIVYAAGTLDTRGEFASLVVIAILGYTVTASLAYAEARIFKWRTLEERR